LKTKIVDTFKPSISFELSEATDEPGALGKIRGVWFVPGGVSRNNRRYPESLWRKVVSSPEIQEKLAHRSMFGTISHEVEINDEALLSGKLSHVMTKMWIEESKDGPKGMAEAIILKSPAGEILHGLLKARAGIYVSSRAYGSLGESEGADGIPLVNEDEYEFSGFDVVLAPGFLECAPTLSESLKKLLDNNSETNNNTTKENIMSEKLLEKLSDELTSSKVSLGTVNESLESERAKNKLLVSENGELKNKLLFFKKKGQMLEAYKTLGEPKDINKVFTLFEDARKKLQAYKELGTPAEINAVLERFDNTLNVIEDLGGLPAVRKSIDGSIDVLSEYLKLGTPREIKKVFSYTNKQLEDKKDLDNRVMIEKLSQKLGVAREKIATLYPRMSEQEIMEFFANDRPANVKKEIYKKGNKSITESLSAINRNLNAPAKSSKINMFEKSGKNLMDYFSK